MMNMFKHSLALTGMILMSLAANAQTGKCYRYKDIIFSDVRIKKGLSYNKYAQIDDQKAYLFDLYQPKDDAEKGRPLIIWMHGGGFKFGSNDAKGIQIWSKTFAQRGYVCAAINYRLSKHNPLFHFDELLKSTYYAVQDAKTAVEYFRAHAKEYHIDPDKIILAGNSAGGIIALQAAYSSNAELANKAGIPDSIAGTKSKKIFKVAGVINFWGAIYNIDWLKNTSVPIVSVLGSNDSVVPPTHKNGISGGIDIHHQADSLHIPNNLKVFEGYSHELRKHFNPIFASSKSTEKRWLDAGQFAADFLYKTVISK